MELRVDNNLDVQVLLEGKWLTVTAEHLLLFDEELKKKYEFLKAGADTVKAILPNGLTSLSRGKN